MSNSVNKKKRKVSKKLDYDLEKKKLDLTIDRAISSSPTIKIISNSPMTIERYTLVETPVSKSKKQKVEDELNQINLLNRKINLPKTELSIYQLACLWTRDGEEIQSNNKNITTNLTTNEQENTLIPISLFKREAAEKSKPDLEALEKLIENKTPVLEIEEYLRLNKLKWKSSSNEYKKKLKSNNSKLKEFIDKNKNNKTRSENKKDQNIEDEIDIIF